MEKTRRLEGIGLFEIIWMSVFSGIIVLSSLALNQYKGDAYVYILFTIVSTTLLYFGFRKGAIFFDTFIGVFLWLGFWLKLTVRVAFLEGEFNEAVGNFDGTGIAFDQALLVTSCAFLGLITDSYIRERFMFVYPPGSNEVTQNGLLAFYRKYRTWVLWSFAFIVLAVSASNLYFGFYQRGTITRTILPYGLNGVYKWLILFGLASFSAVILRLEYLVAKKTLYLVAVLSLLESFLSNVSLLSRGMILNTSALVYGVYKALNFYRIKSSFRFLVICFVFFLFLFASSVLIVNYLRTVIQMEAAGTDSYNIPLSDLGRSTNVLFLDRWVGIEGVMSVSSYPDQGWLLMKTALQEKYSENSTSFYDMNIITSPYIYTDKSKHHFVSMPGFVGFAFYPGSYVFLFISMLVLSLCAFFIEYLVYKLGGQNIILCALLAQVVAYRYAHFGYVPAQSYLLFGALFLNIFIIYATDKLLALWLCRGEASNDKTLH